MSALTLENPAAPEETEVLGVLSALRTNGDALAELLDEIFDDLDSLGGEVELRTRLLEETRKQTADQTAELQAVRHAEALARAELVGMRQEIEQARAQLSKLPSENHELREHLHALELERCSLESELEALRVRTAELADHLAEVKRETADERAEWSTELKQLRRTLERQSELLADRLAIAQSIAPPSSPAVVPQAVSSASPERVATPVAANPPTAKDAVLGSVMAQFEMLQKDRQRRRESRS